MVVIKTKFSLRYIANSISLYGRQKLLEGQHCNKIESDGKRMINTWGTSKSPTKDFWWSDLQASWIVSHPIFLTSMESNEVIEPPIEWLVSTNLYLCPSPSSIHVSISQPSKHFYNITKQHGTIQVLKPSPSL